VVVIVLANNGWVSIAMLTLMASMFYPLLRILRFRKTLSS